MTTREEIITAHEVILEDIGLSWGVLSEDEKESLDCRNDSHIKEHVDLLLRNEQAIANTVFSERERQVYRALKEDHVSTDEQVDQEIRSELDLPLPESETRKVLHATYDLLVRILPGEYHEHLEEMLPE